MAVYTSRPRPHTLRSITFSPPQPTPSLPTVSDPTPPMTSTSFDLNRPLPGVPRPDHTLGSETPNGERQRSLSSGAWSVDSESSSSSRPRMSRNSTLRPLSSFMPRVNLGRLQSSLQNPTILADLLAHLDWNDTLSLLNTCRDSRRLFQIPRLKETILARFVPGFSYCLRNRDLRPQQEIPISIHDLDLLLLSQKVPLHRYPMHALKTLTALYPTFEDDELTEKLVAYTQAHSRFVLYLQSIAHSSSAPPPHEPEEIRWASRNLPTHNLRELTFPAPLSYSEKSPAPETALLSAGKRRPKRSLSLKHKSTPSHHHAADDTQLASPSAFIPLKTHTPRPSADSASSMMSRNDLQSITKKSRRISLFGKKAYGTPEPPALPEPRALKMYSTTWRRTMFQSESGAQGAEWFTDEVGSLKRPHRRFASANASSDSSIAGSGGSPSPLSFASRSDSGGSPGTSSPLRMTSPHDLSLAASRVRAPILRVFVPCTTLEDGSENLVLCEQFLADTGLWEYLSTGDIVCNLGYVPPNDPSGDPPTPGSSNSDRKWLLFNGSFLVPYAPPELLPLDEPLSLPSPFYYYHIMPPFTNPRFMATHLPVCDDIPQLTLVYVTSKVRSPHSPNGYAVVKKYAWTARVVRTQGSEMEEMGEGWLGEWVLEGEGTKEGRKELLDVLAGAEMGRREWEVVRERSGGGRIWVRLLSV
ncbi:hypothetical protein BDQ12DRAFT_704468 [Crucibulum laeve]|uniref:F-box domain-containing protein n=1 Tax=Crucibulum laeve TaxID=68775 RepID=A0A5C3M408_9AGAR|nr:hypothetical protein BDQ12DRAFT_704468 [Crucibulum laeve]